MAEEPARATGADVKEARECPYCKEEIKAEAIKCKHCGSQLTPERPDHGGVCPYCKEAINPDAIKCKHCKSDLLADEPGRAGMDRGPRGGCDCDGDEGSGGYFPGSGTSRMAASARIGLDPGIGLDVGLGGMFGAWGCWDSTCCVQWGRCCMPTPRGRRCWTCCVREEPCERCIWPW